MAQHLAALRTLRAGPATHESWYMRLKQKEKSKDRDTRTDRHMEGRQQQGEGVCGNKDAV